MAHPLSQRAILRCEAASERSKVEVCHPGWNLSGGSSPSMFPHHEDQSMHLTTNSTATSDPILANRVLPPRKYLDRPGSIALCASLAINLVLIQWLALSNVTSLQAFFDMTLAPYAWASVLMALGLSVLFGIAASKLVMAGRGDADFWPWMSLSLGAVFIVLSTGCPSCGATMLEPLGIRGGLAEFPLQGLEIKLLGGLLLGGALWASARATPVGPRDGSDGVPVEIVIGRPSAQWMKRWLPLSVLALGSIMSLYLLPRLPDQVKVSFVSDSIAVPPEAGGSTSAIDGSAAQQLAFPADPYTLSVTYGDIGPALLSRGAIDYERFETLFDQVGNPLTDEQRKILRSGSDQRIAIDQGNARFLLNLFWAFGLSNRNPILEQGAMAEASQGDVGRFASTGGWTLGRRAGPDLYSAFEILSLTPEQQRLVENVASQVYRPCCNNHTAFPDCNHGMAMLGMLELMAAQGATEAEMFEAAKQINGFWFPHQMRHVATFFEATQGWDFAEVPGAMAVEAAFFSGSGHQYLVTWMSERGVLEPASGGGASCGV